ncbi:unnamed protein product [Brassica oleracea var. botrytis]
MIFGSYSGNRIADVSVGTVFASSLLLYKQKLVCCLRGSPRIRLRLLIYALG